MSVQTSTGAVVQRQTLAQALPSIIARHWLWVAALTALGLLLRRYHLGYESLWFDEADIVVRAHQSLPTLIGGFAKAGENGPLYTLILHYWLSAIDALPALGKVLHVLFGHNDEALVRGLSALFGTAAIPLMYGLARRVGGPLLGIISAALLTINPFHVWYSQDAKMYTLLVFMVLATSLLYINALERNTIGLWLGYVLATWAMLTVHSMAGLVFVAQLVATPFLMGVRGQGYERQRGAVRGQALEDTQLTTHNSQLTTSRRWVRWLWAVLLVIAPILPILWLRAAALLVGTDVGGWYSPTGLGDILSTIFVTFAVNRADQPWEAIGSVTMGILAIIGVMILRIQNSKLKTQNLVYALWFVPILLFWLVTLKLPLFQPRYLIMALPPYLIMVGAGLVMWKRAQSTIGLVGVVALLVSSAAALYNVNYSQQAQKEDWRGAMAYVQDHVRLRDEIVVFPGYMETAVEYYYKPGGPGFVPKVDIKTIPSLRTENFGDKELNEALLSVVENHERAWLITSPIRQQQEDPQNKVSEWFQYNWITFDTRVFNGVTVYGISFNGQPRSWYPNPDYPEVHEFENGFEFVGYTYELRRDEEQVQPDASFFPLTLYWHDKDKPTTDYIVGITIKDPAGKIVIYQGLGPLNGYWPPSKWPPETQVIDYRDLRLPGGLTPGNYTISVQLYDQGGYARDSINPPLKLKDGGTEIVLKQPLKVVSWNPSGK